LLLLLLAELCDDEVELGELVLVEFEDEADDEDEVLPVDEEPLGGVCCSDAFIMPW
jgi:hypothetical protein